MDQKSAINVYTDESLLGLPKYHLKNGLKSKTNFQFQTQFSQRDLDIFQKMINTDHREKLEDQTFFLIAIAFT